MWPLWHWQIARRGLKSGVCQELGRVENRNDLKLWLHLSIPVSICPLQSSGLCSPLLSARAEVDAQALHFLDEDVKVWNRRATAITGTGWDLRALGGWTGHPAWSSVSTPLWWPVDRAPFPSLWLVLSWCEESDIQGKLPSTKT